MTTPNTPANGGQILTSKRIKELAQQYGIGPWSAIDFVRAIEADLRTALAAPAIPTVDRNAVLEEAAAICDRLSKLYNVPDVGYDNGYTMGATRAAQEIRAIKSAGVLPDQMLACSACHGSGETVVMSDAGPDGYEIPANCPHCNGTGGLDDAYRGVCAILAAEQEKYLKLCGKMYFAEYATAEQTSSAPGRGEQAPTGAAPAPMVPSSMRAPEAAPAPVSGMPDLASLPVYWREQRGGTQFKGGVGMGKEQFYAVADVERLLNPTGETK